MYCIYRISKKRILHVSNTSSANKIGKRTGRIELEGISDHRPQRLQSAKACGHKMNVIILQMH